MRVQGLCNGRVSVRTSVSLSRRSTTAAACGGFAAERPVDAHPIYMYFLFTSATTAHGSLGPRESAVQTASRSVHPFLHGHGRDVQHTETDMQTHTHTHTHTRTHARTHTHTVHTQRSLIVKQCQRLQHDTCCDRG